MNKINESLEARLKCDAQAGKPAFDVRLHDRLMSAVGGDEGTAGSGPTLRIGHMFWIGLAASLVICVGAWWTDVLRPPAQVVTVAPPPSIPMPDELLGGRAMEFQLALRKKMSDEPLAALDQDTRRFTRFLASQLDVFPSQRDRAQ